MNYGIIYKYTSKTTQMSYIGKTTKNSFKRRMRDHKVDIDDKTHFGRAKLKYGFDDFVLSIVEENIPLEKTSDRERYWIKYYDTFNNGYNSTLGGEGGNTYSKKTKEELDIIKSKISKALSGKNNGMAKNPHLVRGKNNPMYGKRPHNAKCVTIQNIDTHEIKTFDRAYKVAEFLGYKSGSVVTDMIKDKRIVNKWKVIKESVETTENIV